jgi:CheY-like chemotaxis protein
LSDDVQGVWRGDAVRIRQILFNLVSNALKFTQEGSVHVAIDQTQRGDLRFKVSDTGIGVAADKLPALFSRFHQADASITRRFGGAGLGLAIRRHLCDLMGGDITAESAEGKGSTFTVILPLEKINAGPAVPETVKSPGGVADAEVVASIATLRILAAEDNPANQLVLRALLESFDVSPVIVGNGRLAVEAWIAGDYDLILMDMQMPEMDGLTATAAIRAYESERGLVRTPIMALSANALKHQIRDDLSSGLDGHVSKPIDLDDLAAVLAGVAEEKLKRASWSPKTHCSA